MEMLRWVISLISIRSSPNPLSWPFMVSKPIVKLFYPLDEFYEHNKSALPAVTPVAPEAVPEPQRRLLVHAFDMTPTLEEFHGGRIGIRVLSKRQSGDAYARQVVLVLNAGQPVEFGGIIIHLQHFPPAAREQILEGKLPLGTILATHKIQHKSSPLAFFRVTSDRVINEALGLTGAHELYGRRNVLLDERGNVLANVVEILPPAG